MTTREHELRETGSILAGDDNPVRASAEKTEALVSHGSARARRMARCGEAYVQEHAWSSLAGAALVGMLAGVCLMRHGGRH